MQGAGDPIFPQIPASRDHFRLDGVGSWTGHLTEIGSPAGPDQRLEPSLAAGAHDLDLEITAACCAPVVVRRAARGSRAGVVAVEYGEAARGRGDRQITRCGSHVVHHPKTVATESTGLGGAG